MKIGSIVLAICLVGLGIYGMSQLSDFGGDQDDLGFILAWVGFGAATLIFAREIWRLVSPSVIGAATSSASAISSQAEKIQKSAKSDKAYKELLKLKTLKDAGAITEDEYSRKAKVLKKEISV